ncbi:MAG TPA: hypothetical protein VJ696_07355, partial [Rhodanobacteraceae bacterium]|nr:hypothetical protein [Rhodanobacteraceae bacterium]
LHLDVAGLPDGASAEFADNDVVPPIATTLTIHAGRATALGQYVFTIRASGASIDHEVGEGLYMTDSAPGQGVIGIDFAGAADLPEVPILPAIDAAGVVAKPNWNVATGLAGSGLALLDESGAGTGASLDWTSEASATLALDPASGDAIMMDAFVDADATASEVAVANLPPNAGGYFVYVYADGDNGAQANTGTYRFEDEDGISSIDIVDAANATFDGTFVQSTGGAGNYAVFFTGGTAFTLMAMPAAGSTHAALNGIQIVRGDRIFASGFD